MKNVAKILLSVALILVAFAAGSAQAGKIIMAVGIDTAFAPAYIAQERGLFKKAGLEVELLRLAQGGEVLDGIIAGQANIGIAADQTTIIRLGRADLKPLAVLHDSKGYIRGVSRANMAFDKIRKMGVVKGTVSEFTASMFAQKYQLENEITYVNANAPEFVALLLRGDIDAFFSWAPFPDIAIKQGAKPLATSDEVGYVTTMWVTASPAWLSSNRDDAQKVLEVLAEADRQITADIPAAAQDFQKQTKLPAADTVPLMGLLDYKLRDFTDQDFVSFNKIADFLAARKATATRVDVTQFIQRGFFKK